MCISPQDLSAAVHRGSVVASELEEFRRNRPAQGDSEATSVTAYKPEQLFLDVKQCSALREQFGFMTRKKFCEEFGGMTPESAKVSMTRVTDWKGSCGLLV